jgi:hypothetical protein
VHPRDEGEPFLTDREGRQLSAVKAELERAFDLAERLEGIVAETETLTRGRIFGPTLARRLRTSIETRRSSRLRSGIRASRRRSSRRVSRSKRSELDWSRRGSGD